MIRTNPFRDVDPSYFESNGGLHLLLLRNVPSKKYNDVTNFKIHIKKEVQGTIVKKETRYHRTLSW